MNGSVKHAVLSATAAFTIPGFSFNWAAMLAGPESLRYPLRLRESPKQSHGHLVNSHHHCYDPLGSRTFWG